MASNGRANHSLKSGRQLEIAARREEVARLRLAGWTFRRLIDEKGYDKTTLSRDWQAVGEQFRAKAVEEYGEYREIQLQRLEGLLEKLYPDVDRPGIKLGTVDRVLAILDREAKLLGLDAPKRQDITSGDKPIEFTLNIGALASDDPAADDDDGDG